MIVTATAIPGTASEDPPVPPNRVIATASATALLADLAGQKQGSGEYLVEHDGTELHTRGDNSPKLPLLEGQEEVVGGALGQDAVATADGTSAACAGLVGRDGTVQVGPDSSCLITGDGRIRLSLGSLEQLGLSEVLEHLPELPAVSELELLELELPDLGLEIEGRAMAASCSATPDGVKGTSEPLQAELVAVVDGERTPIAELPPGGGAIGLGTILEALPSDLTALLDPLLEQLPGGELELPENDLITVRTDEQIEDNGRLTVTALRVAVAPPSGVDLKVGTVACGPNRTPRARPAPPEPEPEPEPTPQPTPTGVPAGLATAPGAGSGSDDDALTLSATSARGAGWVPIAVFAGLALLVGTRLHRSRTHRTDRRA